MSYGPKHAFRAKIQTFERLLGTKKKKMGPTSIARIGVIIQQFNARVRNVGFLSELDRYHPRQTFL
jgi:hypothetical protein